MGTTTDTTPQNFSLAYHLRYSFARMVDQFNGIAWSPDCRYIASGSDDRTVKVYEISSGKLLRTFEAHRDLVWAVAWSPDGKLIASGSGDQTVRVWDTTSGKIILTFEGHKGGVLCVAWSPDSKFVASGAEDQTVRVWDAINGKLILALEGHQNSVWSIAWSPDGELIVSGSYDNQARVWEVSSGKIVQMLEGHQDSLRSVSWSPSGWLIASGSDDQTVRIWEASSGNLIRTLEGHLNWVKSVAWSPDGEMIASGSEDQTIRVWKTISGELLRVLEGHYDGVRSVMWSPDGNLIASGSADGTVRVWEAVSGEQIQQIEGHKNLVDSAAWSPDGELIAIGSEDKGVQIWEASTGRLVQTIERLEDWSYNVVWAPGCKLFACGSADGTVRVWETASSKLISVFEEHQDGVKSVAWSPDGELVASGSADQTVRIWKASTGELIHTLEGHQNWIWSVAWSPDGKLIASGSADGMVRIWEASSGKLIRILKGHQSWVQSLGWSPNSKLIVSGSGDKTVRIWEALSGKLIRVLEGHQSTIRRVAWSPDGRFIASGADDQTVRVWDVGMGQYLQLYAFLHLSHEFLDLTFASAGLIAEAFGQTKLDDSDIIVRDLDPRAANPGQVEEAMNIVTAKIVLVGESGVGKTGLALRLAEDRFEDQGPTRGIRLWPLSSERLNPTMATLQGENREVVIWDLGGRDDYRLIHQLFLRDSTMVLMLLDPTRDNHFADIDEWNLRLGKRLRKETTAKLLVGARADLIDKAMINQSRIESLLDKWKIKNYCLTSAKEDIGIDILRDFIAQYINWNDLSRTTRPRLFQQIRETIEKLRRQAVVVTPYFALEEQIRQSDPDEFNPSAVNTVVEQLARQGAIADIRSSMGARALVLQIEYVEIYARSLVVIARDHANLRGVPAIELSEAIFRRSYPGIEDKDRLSWIWERNVLECVVELMIENGVCLKHEGLLIFPTLFPEATANDSDTGVHKVSLFYEVSEAIDNLYMSLVAQLAVSEKFGKPRLWRDRAEFDHAGRGVCGLRRFDRPGEWAHLDLLFSDETTLETRNLFTFFVEEHLRAAGVTIREALEMECLECRYHFEESVVRKRIEQEKADIPCPICETRSPINEATTKSHADSSTFTRNLTALRKTIEANKRSDIDQAKREMKSVGIFISYAHCDDTHRETLVKHLSALSREGVIDAWHNRMIGAGKEWADEIDRKLESAKIILLLVSADFMASDYCIGIEMKRALERHASGEASVVPILISPVDGWERMPFGGLQPLPHDAKPITTWSNRDEAFADVARGVRRAVEELMRPSEETRPRVIETASPVMPVVEPTPVRILHLSDLHFNQNTDPNMDLKFLVRDLRNRNGGLGFSKLDYLVITGDLTSCASIKEFERVRKFISELIKQCDLTAVRCVIVPGNHDLNWDVKGIYEWQAERTVDMEHLKGGSYVKQGDGYLIRKDASYPNRFENFNKFWLSGNFRKCPKMLWSWSVVEVVAG